MVAKEFFAYNSQFTFGGNRSKGIGMVQVKEQNPFSNTPDFPNLQGFLDHHANLTPDATFLIAPGKQSPLTYQGLSRHVAHTLRVLHYKGIGHGDCVAMVLPNGPEMITASIAVMAGAIGAPLNPAMRREEFEFFLSDLNPKCLLLQADSDSPARAVAKDKNIPVLDLMSSPSESAGIFTLSGSTDLSPGKEGLGKASEITLLLHTSGTTVSPKLVPLTHGNIWHSAYSIQKVLELHAHDRCLNIMPLFHIHGLCTIWSSLVAGGSIVGAPAFNSRRFFEWMKDFQPTWYTAAPTIHQAILAEAANYTADIARSPLRFIRSASSALPPTVMKELERTFQAPVVESYGMTEAGPQICSNPLPPLKRKPGSVGLPMGPEVAITDTHGNFLEWGQTGEVVIRGTNVIDAYRNNPIVNQEAFFDGWFRTGDQGYQDQDGYLFLTGRLKELINRGGEKIVPREVEEVLLEHPAVTQAVVFPFPHPTLGQDIAAAVVLQHPGSTTAENLRMFVSGRLAHFKVPARVKIVTEIPKGTASKYQRGELARELGIEGEIRARYEAPRNPLEKKILEFWQDILQVHSIGIHDDFFELGGDSIRAGKIMARIEEAWEVELPFIRVFEYPTVLDLAILVEREKQELDGEDLVGQDPSQ